MMCVVKRILFCLGIAVTFVVDSAVAELPESFVVCAVVVDADGNPVTDANVDLVGSAESSVVVKRRAKPIALLHQADGVYQATASIDDPRLLRQSESVLVANSPGRSLHVEKIRFARLFSGVPVKINLGDRHPDGVLVVVDAEGKPVADATVRPSAWDRTPIPLSESLSISKPTDANGKTSASWIDPARLSMVVVESQSVGNQCLPITLAANGEVKVVALPTYEIQGKWSSPIEMTNFPTFFEEPLAVTQTVPSDPGSDSTMRSYVWAETKPRRDGTLIPIRLSEGDAVIGMRLSNAIPLVTKMESLKVSRDKPFELKLYAGIRVGGKIIEETSGEPLAGILIRQFSYCRAEPLTGADGRFELWFSDDDRICFYPRDATGRHMSADSFYYYPLELPVDGELELKPTPLVSMPKTIGSVVDHKGRPVAGSTVIGQYKSERSNDIVFLYSDQKGQFPFIGVLPGATIELTAMAEGMMSAEPTRLTLSDDATPEVVVKPRHAIRVRGKIVDRQSKPIAGASILLRTAYVSEEESYGGENAAARALTEPVDPIITDANGEFVSSPILDWQRRLSLQADASSRRTLQTYWTDATASGEGESDLDFGTLVMLPEWPIVTQSIEVVDSESGKPLAGARVACRGAYVTQQRGTTDDEGRIGFELRDSTAVFAADCPGYHPAFEIRQAGKTLDTISLVPDRLPAVRRTGVAFSQTEKIAFAKQLLAKVDKPTPLDTPHRLSRYYQSLGYADFDQMLSDAKTLAAIPQLKPAIAQELMSVETFDAKQTDAIKELISDEYRFYWLMKRAKTTSATEDQLDLFGEAMVMIQNQSGDVALANIGRLAMELLKIGERETAQQLLTDAYRDHGKLQRILDGGKREEVAGVARIYLPVYAIVNPERALALIRLTAFADEVSMLQTLAVRVAVEYADKDAAEVCKAAGLEKLDARGLVGYYVDVEHRSVERAMSIADLCEDDSSKADFFLALAKSADADRETKATLARRALQILTSEEIERGGLIPGHWLTEHADEVAQWDTSLAEEYRFEAFWAAKESNIITPFPHVSTLAQNLASEDVEVARALIEPCFDDWSWLFGQRDIEVMFSRNGPLSAAAAIDHQWALALIDELFKQHLSDYPSRKLEIISGVILP